MQRLLLAAAIAAVTFQARADVVSQMQFQPDWSNLETLSFQKFDPTLGTLLSVQVSASADVGSVLTFTADVSGFWDVLVENDFRLGLPFGGNNYLKFGQVRTISNGRHSNKCSLECSMADVHLQ